jgi:2-iminobutanoate/2-iminopropanoate deaminase
VKRIHTDNAPAAVGPYSQGIDAGNLVFCSGQAGLDPATGQLVEGVEAQTRQIFSNLSAVLEAAGLSLDDVVKTTVFLADMADFKAMNAIYATFFGETPPARSTVAVKGLPIGALVEIDAIAVRS